MTLFFTSIIIIIINFNGLSTMYDIARSLSDYQNEMHFAADCRQTLKQPPIKIKIVIIYYLFIQYHFIVISSASFTLLVTHFS